MNTHRDNSTADEAAQATATDKDTTHRQRVAAAGRAQALLGGVGLLIVGVLYLIIGPKLALAAFATSFGIVFLAGLTLYVVARRTPTPPNG